MATIAANDAANATNDTTNDDSSTADLLSSVLRCFENCRPARNAVRRLKPDLLKVLAEKLDTFANARTAPELGSIL
jgi:hypothetical protein